MWGFEVRRKKGFKIKALQRRPTSTLRLRGNVAKYSRDEKDSRGEIGGRVRGLFISTQVRG